MKVLIVEPGKYPREADIEHTLEGARLELGTEVRKLGPIIFLKDD